MRTYDELLEENARLRAEIARQAQRIEELERVLDELRRTGKRQAAPFSRGAPKSRPKKPGRKPGEKYGRQALRPVPSKVDEIFHVGCPLYCPDCSGQVVLESQESQFQIDLPRVRPTNKVFVFDVGRCLRCGRRIQGRHPQQVSEALTVGRVHFGPGVLGLSAHLNKIGGLSYGKIAALLKEWAGFEVSRSALCRAMQRLAKKARPSYDGLISKIRGSPAVYVDETGWKVGGLRSWLWGFTTLRETVYSIQRGRGYREAAAILGEDFAGILGVDGWAPYRCFEQATLQTCLTHLLRRCSEILETANRGAVRFPRQVQAVLSEALELRDRRDAGTLSDHGLKSLRGRLEARMARLLSGTYTNPENRRFAQHLRRYEAALFVFLHCEGIEATNWPAEHAMRAGVTTRKCCGGGNRTERGADCQAIVMSILRTCHQKSLGALEVIAAISRMPEPQPLAYLVDG